MGRTREALRRPSALGSIAAMVSQKMRWLGIPPKVSQTVAATMPPGRTTRRISRTACRGSGTKLQDQHGQGAIELIVSEWQRAGIALPCGDPRVGVSLPQCVDKLFLKIDGLDGRDVCASRNRERQAAGPTADIDDVLSVDDPRKVQKQRGQTSAPSAHILIVSVSAF